ncbi:MAG: chemotaxis response regulator protein-glutamate methylesterase [Ectothiorhodospiraceae bacterium]|nr:chemotaxis response regulator protein-glutamate methylesterase [Chromatiales bacterium]MCP5154767.1 chemotaxis response regulator protein-glutamate methylesterase [Ectothiorhodospiraceae bacterium]
MNNKIRVLVVDDSALVRKLLTRILDEDPGIEVVGNAPDPYVARDKIKALSPDVLTLDVEMPRMDGITFLRNLMRLRPMPVVMISSLTEQGADVTLEALEVGAVDFITKPALDVAHGLDEYARDIVAKVKMAARVPPGALARKARRLAAVTTEPGSPPPPPSRRLRTTDRVLAIGASTGGTEAIRAVLERLGPDCPGTVIAQHIPLAFSASFAARLDRMCPLSVKQADDGDPIIPGHAYVAPGDSHLMVVRDGARYRCKLSQEAPVNRHRPSVDVLFDSVARNVGPNAIGVILTGMGADGARGLKSMRDNGAPTVAQDASTSVVWGMPGEAVKMDAASHVLPLADIPTRLLELARV